ncbi:hypothetical protein Tco_0450570 [Tanacetum coccineum]
MLVRGEADSETSPKRSLRRKLFKTCCMNWGEVNPTHAYYNGSCTSKDTEDPSWSTSFKTRRTQKTSSALEALWKTLFVLYLYLIGTLAQHKMEYERRVNERQLQTTEEKTDTSNALDALDANIRPIYNEEPMAEVQMTADDNVSATRQQHTEQPEFINE